MYLLVLLAFFTCFALLGYVTVALLFPHGSVVKDQLQFYEAQWQRAHGRLDDKADAKLGMVVKIVAMLAGRRGLGDLIAERLQRAGLEIEPAHFIGVHVLAAIGVSLAGLWLWGVVAMVILLALATTLPLIYIDRAYHKRCRLFHEQLPETLQMVSGSLKAGYGFVQAVDMVARETEPPMSVEFGRVLTDARLGLPVEQALDKMAYRVDSTDFSWTVMAVRIQREVGGNLAEVLENLSGTIRERDQIGRQIQVLTAEGRLSAMILFCLPFFLAIILYFMNRDYISLLFTTSAGLIMLAAAGALMAVGGVWLRKIIRIEV